MKDGMNWQKGAYQPSWLNSIHEKAGMLATTLINCHCKRMGLSVLLWNTRDLNRLAVWKMNTSEPT